MTDCIFCKIAEKQMETDFIYEDDDVVAFNDIYPEAPVHVLIIPKKHIRNLLSLESGDEGIIGKMIGLSKKLAERFSVSQCGFRLVANAGPDAGQEVDHIHFHFLGGRKFGWPPG